MEAERPDDDADAPYDGAPGDENLVAATRKPGWQFSRLKKLPEKLPKNCPKDCLKTAQK